MENHIKAFLELFQNSQSEIIDDSKYPTSLIYNKYGGKGIDCESLNILYRYKYFDDDIITSRIFSSEIKRHSVAINNFRNLGLISEDYFLKICTKIIFNDNVTNLRILQLCFPKFMIIYHSYLVDIALSKGWPKILFVLLSINVNFMPKLMIWDIDMIEKGLESNNDQVANIAVNIYCSDIFPTAILVDLDKSGNLIIDNRGDILTWIISAILHGKLKILNILLKYANIHQINYLSLVSTVIEYEHEYQNSVINLLLKRSQDNYHFSLYYSRKSLANNINDNTSETIIQLLIKNNIIQNEIIIDALCEDINMEIIMNNLEFLLIELESFSKIFDKIILTQSLDDIMAIVERTVSILLDCYNIYLKFWPYYLKNNEQEQLISQVKYFIIYFDVTDHDKFILNLIFANGLTKLLDILNIDVKEEYNQYLEPCFPKYHWEIIKSLYGCESNYMHLYQYNECAICFEKLNMKYLFSPCGHTCCCDQCYPRLKSCPLCKANIDGGYELKPV